MGDRTSAKLILPREVVLAIFAMGLVVGLLFQAKYRRHEREYIQSLEQRIRLLEDRNQPAASHLTPESVRRERVHPIGPERSETSNEPWKEEPLLLC